VPEANLTGGLVLNGALLLSLALATGIVPDRFVPERRWTGQLALGALIAGFGVSVMLVPVTLTPGLVFDVRSVLLALSGLFFGIVPTAVAMVVTAALRWSMGGVGATLGIAVIFASGLIGIAWRHWRREQLHQLRARELYAFGALVHVVMIAILSALPGPVAAQFWREAVGPILLVYPLLTLLVGRVLVGRVAHERLVDTLRASEQRFRHLFEDSASVMLMVDPRSGRICDANRAALEFYGWDYATLVTMSVTDIHVQPASEVRGAMEVAQRTGHGRFEFQQRRADGSVRDVEVISGPIDRHGEALMYALVIDVHERRLQENERLRALEREAEAQRALNERRRSERIAALNLAEDALRNQRQLAATVARLELLMEHAPAALALLDRELRFNAVSRRFLTDYGLVGLDVVGRHHYDVFPEIPDRLREVHQRALRGEVLRNDNDVLVRQDGSVMLQRWEVRPWFDVTGAIGGIVLFTEDVTQMMRAQEQLVKLSQAVEQSPESIVITNLEAEIEYVNDAFLRATGYTRAEVLGQNPRVLNSGKTPPETHRAMWEALSAGRSWKGEFINRRKDGSEYVEFATVSAVVDGQGRVTHYLAVKEDITEKKRAAQELNQYRHHLETLVHERTVELQAARERAEVASRAKSEFLANMSHEIRTPLNAVVGLTHLLLRDDPTPRQRDRLVKVDGAAGHLLSIISDVLDLSKIEAGKFALDVRDFHLSSVLDQVSSMVAETARAKGLTLEIDRDHVPLWLRGDPARLRQALLNLAGNAVKFTERGSVALRAELLADGPEGLLVRFEVVDTGVGIDPARLPALFEAFEQADASITRAFGGTGLGLTITRRLAELMGGEVGAESEPGVGTRVWFTVQLARGHGVMPVQHDALTAAAASRWPLFEGGRVLLVEDHPINREVAEEILHGFGLDVSVAENGRVAVERVQREAFDLILMDMQMPELDGLAATRAIRALPQRSNVPIIAMTANAFEEDRQACFAAGMNDFVAKPVDPNALGATLALWLERKPAAADPLEAASSVSEGARRHTMPRDLELLRRFASAHARDEERLRHELAAGELDLARQRMHALKGVAATLGVLDVQAAAEAIERALVAGEGEPLERVGSQRLQLLHAALERLQREFAQAPRVDAADQTVLPRAELEALLRRLEPLLDTDDADAVELLRGHGAALHRAYGSHGDLLAAAVDRFDFATARQVLQRLVEPTHSSF